MTGAGSQIVRAAAHTLIVQAQHMEIIDVIDMHEVPALRAVPVNRVSAPFEQMKNERTHHRRYGPAIVLPRAIHVEVAQRSECHPAEARIRVREETTRILAHGVMALGCD